MDRRQHVRFDLSAPVTYVWNDHGGVRQSASGFTRDVSKAGVFVVAELLPPPGETVQLDVLFSFQDTSRIRMRAEGKIVRVEDGNRISAATGFAVEAKNRLRVNAIRGS